MSQRIRIASIAEVPLNEGREYVAGGRIVALFHTESGVWAMDGICPHAGGPIAQGALTGCLVTCPWHGWQFDVTTGRHCLNAQLQHPSFPVEVVDGEVFVELP